jgi:hypothetical protein
MFGWNGLHVVIHKLIKRSMTFGGENISIFIISLARNPKKKVDISDFIVSAIKICF